MSARTGTCQHPAGACARYIARKSKQVQDLSSPWRFSLYKSSLVADDFWGTTRVNASLIFNSDFYEKYLFCYATTVHSDPELPFWIYGQKGLLFKVKLSQGTFWLNSCNLRNVIFREVSNWYSVMKSFVLTAIFLHTSYWEICVMGILYCTYMYVHMYNIFKNFCGSRLLQRCKSLLMVVFTYAL